ncbi:hypothetical protein BJV78DRAFT_1354130 [Lactifluus subvellereus]|nr:hypothetical protein BJV78DRAFT_1354130 [Lactifluus subvellereus]
MSHSQVAWPHDTGSQARGHDSEEGRTWPEYDKSRTKPSSHPTRHHGPDGVGTRTATVERGNLVAWHSTTTVPATAVSCTNDAEILESYLACWTRTMVAHKTGIDCLGAENTESPNSDTEKANRAYIP